MAYSDTINNQGILENKGKPFWIETVLTYKHPDGTTGSIVRIREGKKPEKDEKS